MDTSGEARTTDKLGRRTAPRRKYTIAEKRRIVEEAQQLGASVAVVAQRHAINANVVFSWRRLYRKGLLSEGAPSASPLLPVRVSTPTLVPSSTSTRVQLPERTDRRDRTSGSIEIELRGGERIRVQGRVRREALVRVLEVLLRASRSAR